MNQRTFWNSRFKRRKRIGEPTPFAKKVLPLILKKKYKKILDLGCGDGRDTIFFSNKGLDVIAVDFSKNAIKNLESELRKKGIKNAKCEVIDICKDLKLFKNNSFDAIYSHLSLHYFRDKITDKIFNELFGILKKGGLIFIKVKSIEDPLYGKGKLIEKDMFFYEHIRHFFTKEYLKEKLKRFKILKMEKSSAVYHKYKSVFIEAMATK